MTGYGEVLSLIDDCEWRCIVQSVNSRNLDARFRLPSRLNVLENTFRKIVHNRIPRGKVDITFSFSPQSTDNISPADSSEFFNASWIADFCRAGEGLLDTLSWQSSDHLRATILQGAFLRKDAFLEPQFEIDNVADPLSKLLHAALDKHFTSRQQEGKHLAADIVERLSQLDVFIAAISKKAALMPNLFRERINLRIDTILSDRKFELDQARLSQEVAHLIDKADVSEEIVRFQSHITQFLTEINDQSSDRKGKKLEFIVQEMLREVNTVGSKANLLEITNGVVEIKNELEKIREQVQNVV